MSTSVQQIVTTYGSSIDLDLVWKDDDGEPIDVSPNTFRLTECYPPTLAVDFVITKTDPAAGRIHLSLPADAALRLLKGNLNRLRVTRYLGEEIADASELFGINVQ